MKIKISFITNSSSSHSIICTDRKLKDKIPGDYYGWEDFVLVSPKEKAKYLAATLFLNLNNLMNDGLVKSIVKQETGVDITDSAIDHQSLISIPYTTDEKGPNLEFFRELYNYVMKSNVVILGGNDNSDPNPQYRSNEVVLRNLPRDTSNRMICVKENDQWIIFYRISSRKVIISFKNNEIINERPVPEIVYMKISRADDTFNRFDFSHPERIDFVESYKVASYLTMFEKSNVLQVCYVGERVIWHSGFFNFRWLTSYTPTEHFESDYTEWLNNDKMRENFIKYGATFIYDCTYGNPLSLYEKVAHYNLYGKCSCIIKYVIRDRCESLPERLLDVCKVTHLPLLISDERSNILKFDVVKVIKPYVKKGCIKVLFDSSIKPQTIEKLESEKIRDLVFIENPKTTMFLDCFTNKISLSRYDPVESQVSLPGYKYDDDTSTWVHTYQEITNR